MNLKSTDLTPLQLVSTYRSELMGCAILWVLYIHSSVSPHSAVLSKIQVVGYGGVDVFMFLSGLGVYRSLSKNRTLDFLKHRISRILPTWIFILLFDLIVSYLLYHTPVSFRRVLTVLTFTAYWLSVPGRGNWYVYTIMLFYLLSPVLYAVLTESRSKTRAAISLVCFSLLFSLAFLENVFLIAFSRLPLYIIGMIFAEYGESRKISFKNLLLSLLVLSIGISLLTFSFKISAGGDGTLLSYGLYWYPFILIAPPLCILTAAIMNLLSSYIRPLLTLLRLLGSASLEMLLLSDWIYSNTRSWADGGLTSWLLMLASVLSGLFLHFLLDKLRKIISTKALHS